MPAAIPGPPPIANATVAGLLSAVAQSIGGDKTFIGKIINSLPLGLKIYTTGTLPSAVGVDGHIVYNSTTSKVMFSDGAAWVALDVSSGSFVSKTGDTMTGPLLLTGTGNLLVVDTADNTLVVDATNNRVGIGIAAPVVNLDILGADATSAQTRIRNFSNTAADRSILLFDRGRGTFASPAALSANDSIGDVTWRGHYEASANVATVARIAAFAEASFSVSNTPGYLAFSTTLTSTLTERMRIKGNGDVAIDTNVLYVDAVNNRVGILSITPSSPLEVAGIIHSTVGGIKFPDNTTQTSAAVHRVGDTMTGALVITGAGMTIDSADNTLVVNATTNRVGIGTATPTRSLDVTQAVASDYLVHLQNTDVGGASGIAFVSNGGTERLRIGYGNPSFGSPGTGLNFWHTDGVTDTVIAHAGVEFHRFLSNGNVKFDQADNLLVVDAGNNRIGIGIAAPTAGFLVDMTTSLASNGNILRIRNTSASGHGAIEFWHTSSAVSQGSIGYGGGTVTDGGGSAFSIDMPAGLTFRNGTSNFANFDTAGRFIVNATDNVLYVDGVPSNKRVGINTATFTPAGGFTPPFVVELGTTGTRSVLVRGGGLIRKGISILDTTNSRTWTWDHSTSGNNNRFEAWYHNGTSEARILTLTTDGRLGINNVTPGVALDVDGSAQFTGSLTVDTNTLVVDATANQVGIGTTPGVGNKLDVAGDIAFSLALKPAGLAGTAGQILQSNGAGAAPTWVAPAVASIAIGNSVTSGTPGSILFVNASSSLGQDNANLFWDDPNNRLGIGTATPTEALDVVGNVRFSGALMPNNTAGTSGQVLTSAGTGVVPTWTTPATGTVTGTGSSGYVAFWTGTNTISEDTDAGGQLFWDATNGRLCIGGATPNSRLHVVGNLQIVNGDFRPDNLPGTAGQYLTSAGPNVPPVWITPTVVTGSGTAGKMTFWSSTSAISAVGGGMIWDNTNHRLAVGTSPVASPTRSFEVTGQQYLHHAAIGINPAMQVEKDLDSTIGNPHLWLGGNAHNSSGGRFEIDFGYTLTPGTTYPPGAIGLVTTDTAGSTKGDLYFATRDVTTGATVPIERLRIKANGDAAFDTDVLYVDAVNNRVGINTTSPSSSLHIKNASNPLFLEVTSASNVNQIVFNDSGSSSVASLGYGNASAPALYADKMFLAMGSKDLSIVNATVELARFKTNGDFYVDTNVLYVDAAGNQVGIGTATPGYALHVLGDANVRVEGSSFPRYSINLTSAGSDLKRWQTYATATALNHAALNDAEAAETIYMKVNRTSGITINSVEISAGNFFVDTNTLFVDATNNRVGIGTATPGVPLDVVGAATISGKTTFGAANQYFGVTSITAFATGGQASATQLTGEVNFVTTVATTGDSVKLVTAALGLKVVVFNDGANSVDIFPATGGQIDALGTNTAYALAAGSSRTFWGKTATDWRSM